MDRICALCSDGDMNDDGTLKCQYARAYRLKPIVPRQCVQDRPTVAHEWNLFDIDAKFGDVVEIEEVLD